MSYECPLPRYTGIITSGRTFDEDDPKNELGTLGQYPMKFRNKSANPANTITSNATEKHNHATFNVFLFSLVSCLIWSIPGDEEEEFGINFSGIFLLFSYTDTLQNSLVSSNKDYLHNQFSHLKVITKIHKHTQKISVTFNSCDLSTNISSLWSKRSQTKRRSVFVT